MEYMFSLDYLYWLSLVFGKLVICPKNQLMAAANNENVNLEENNAYVKSHTLTHNCPQ